MNANFFQENKFPQLTDNELAVKYYTAKEHNLPTAKEYADEMIRRGMIF